MKKKMILDVIMSAIIVLLMKTVFTGMLLHELLGLFVFLLFLLHKFLNFKWIKGVAPKIFTRKIPTKTKVMFGIDVLLFICVTFIVISGVLISQNILTSIQGNNLLFWSTWHHFTAYSALVLISIHIGLHWQSIMNMTKKIFKLSGNNAIRTSICRILAVIIMFFGIKVLFKPDIKENFTAPFIPEKSDDESDMILSTSSSDNSDDKIVAISSTTHIVEDAPSLDEYLGNLFCQGCGRHCPLNALSCSRGKSYQNSAIEDYNELYTIAVEDSTETSTNSDNETQAPSTDNKTENKDDETSQENNFETNITRNETPFDYIFLMGLFIGATHYIITIPKKFS